MNFGSTAEANKSSASLKSAATGLGVVIFIAGCVLFMGGFATPPGEKPHQDYITGFIMIGGALGIIAMARGWFDAESPITAMNGRLFCLVASAAGFGIGLFIRIFGMHQIGGFDHSVLVDAAWRMYTGQTAYVDFPCTVPVAFLTGAKFALQWFGVSWASIIDLTALFAMGTFAWALYLLVQMFGQRWTTLLWAVTMQAMSVMLACFWWYNIITSISAALYVLAAVVWLHRPRAAGAMISYGCSLLLISTMKPNVAGILVPMVSIILFTSPPHRWRILAISAGALAAFFLFLFANHLDFKGMINGYLSVAQRVASIKEVYEFTPTAVIYAYVASLLLVMLPTIVAISLGWRAMRLRGSLIASAVLAGGLYGFLTNGELKLVDLSPILISALVLVAHIRGPAPSAEVPILQMPVRWNRCLSFICVILAFAGVAQGSARDRIKSIGMPQFFEWEGAKHVMVAGFFKGVVCGDIFFEVNREIADVLRQAGAASVWFGPRMQWGYAAFGRPSPSGQPIWWHPGVAFAKSDEDMYFKRLLDSKFDLLILFKNDIAYYSRDEAVQLQEKYEVNQQFPLLTILIRKK